MGLIIGRNPNEYIPDEEGWIWATLDAHPSSVKYPEYAMKCALKNEDKKIEYYHDINTTRRDKGADCYHFNIDTSTNEFMGYTGKGAWRSFINKAILMLNGFDTVVIDWSTLQIFQNSTRPPDFELWKSLKDLLNIKPESKLIVELAPFAIIHQDNPEKRISKHRNSSLHVESNLYYGQLLDNAKLFKMLGADLAKSAIKAKRQEEYAMNRTIILTKNGLPRIKGTSLQPNDKFIVLREDYEAYTIMYLETLFDEIEVKKKGDRISNT